MHSIQLDSGAAGLQLTGYSLSSNSLATESSQSHSHIATDDQSVSKSWYRATSWGS
jgi:hypothetical protein